MLTCRNRQARMEIRVSSLERDRDYRNGLRVENGGVRLLNSPRDLHGGWLRVHRRGHVGVLSHENRMSDRAYNRQGFLHRSLTHVHRHVRHAKNVSDHYERNLGDPHVESPYVHNLVHAYEGVPCEYDVRS